MRPARSEGFTLIEVLVALVVAVAAFSVIAQGFTTGGRASVGAQQATKAATLASRLLVDLETGEIPIDSSRAGKFDDEPGFSWDVRSEPDEPGLRYLTVTVRWTDRVDERSFVLVRLLRERTQTP
jgi:prepilin-type N-terminal cleavage/methylation domain-containing protein